MPEWAGDWSRREVLAGVGAAGVSAVTGCADSPDGREPPETGSSPSAAVTPAAESTGQDTEATGATATATETATNNGYERLTVVASDPNGTELATVDVRVADTSDKRYTGLSATDSLAPDEGMLFVHPQESQQSYVMRGMSFPLDIVFVGANGTVTRVYHADVGGTDAPYQARARYVLEVNRGWTNRTGVTVGDRIRIPEDL
ncbi:MAG: uncharacterized membrane protein (UPF0127 family) [Natronomonas sp.]|jgi:uncharacterized membrane protein (UPF0127 family)